MKTYFDEVQTANPGSTWVTLPTVGLSQVAIFNNSDADLDVRRADATSKVIKLPAGTSLPLSAENSNEYQLKRTDNSNTQITIPLIIEK